MKVKNQYLKILEYWPSIQYKFRETTIMEKTADLVMIQKTNIDALHKEGKSQRVIERCGCLQSAVSEHIKCKVDWKEEFG